jgi:hypothetical protein
MAVKGNAGDRWLQMERRDMQFAIECESGRRARQKARSVRKRTVCDTGARLRAASQHLKHAQSTPLRTVGSSRWRLARIVRFHPWR